MSRPLHWPYGATSTSRRFNLRRSSGRAGDPTLYSWHWRTGHTLEEATAVFDGIDVRQGALELVEIVARGTDGAETVQNLVAIKVLKRQSGPTLRTRW